MVAQEDRPRSSSARGRLWLWIRRVLLALVGVVLVVLLAGLGRVRVRLAAGLSHERCRCSRVYWCGAVRPDHLPRLCCPLSVRSPSVFTRTRSPPNAEDGSRRDRPAAGRRLRSLRTYHTSRASI